MELKSKTSEELEQIIVTTSDIKEQVDARRFLAKHILHANPARAGELCEVAIAKAEEHQYFEGAAYAMLIAGLAKIYYSDNAAGMVFYNRALTLFKSLGIQDGIIRSYNSLGSLHNFLGDYTRALHYLELATDTAEKVTDTNGMAESSLAIADVFWHLDDTSKAIRYYQKALQLFEAIEDTRNVAWSTHKIAGLHQATKQYDSAIELFERAMSISELIGFQQLTGICKRCIASVYADKGEFQKALECVNSAKELIETTDKQNGSALLHIVYSEIYIGLGNLPKAIEHLEQAIHLAEKMGRQQMLVDFHYKLAELYQKQKKWKQACEEYNLYHELKNKVKSDEAIRAASNFEIQKQLIRSETEHEVTNRMLSEVKKERDRSENLLLNILPAEVAEELKANGSAAAKQFDEVTVLYTDFVSFTKVGERLTPQQLVDELNVCFKAFDEIISKYNIEKIKTMGDGFIAAAGLPTANISHAEDMISAALEIRDFMLQRRIEQGENTFEMRIGINSGPVVAGIVGVKKFAYDIWGDTVTTAARMEQNSEAGKINISQTTFELVKDKFSCEYRGEIEAKNKGKLKMYFVN